MALASLDIRLTAQLAELSHGMDKATRLAERSAKAIESKFSGLTRVVGVTAGALGGLFAAAGISSFLRTTIDGIDKLNDLADATGASVENLSALEDVAVRTGTSIDVVGDAIVKLNKNLSEAKPGSEQANILKALGLNAEELRRIDPAEALQLVAKALAGFADDGQKARIVQELFGKSIKEVAPLLKDLAEQGQINATVTREQAEQVEKLKRQMAELDKNAQDFARTIASALVPTLNKMFEAVKKGGLLELFKPSETQRQIAEAESLSRSITVVGNALQRASANAQNMDLPGSARAKWAQDAAALRKQLEDLQRQAVQSTDRLKGTIDGTGQRSARDLLRGMEAGSAERPSLPNLPGATKERKQPSVAEFGPFLPPPFAAALKAIDEADEKKLAALREQLAELTRIVAQGGEVPDSVFAKVAEEMARLDPAARKAAEETEELKRRMEEGKRVFEETRTPSERLSLEIERLTKLLDQGAISWDTYARATFDAQEAFDKAMKPALEELSEFAKEAQRNIQDALGNSILASMEGNAKSIGDIWKNMLKRMVAEAAAARLAESLFGKDGRSGSGTWVGTAIDWWRRFSGGGSWGGSSAGGMSNGIPSGGGSMASGGVMGKTSAPAGMSKGGDQFVINVHGDYGPRAARRTEMAIQAHEARQQRRYAMGSA